MTVFYGIDVSDYQNGLDLKLVKEQGYTFVISQATHGNAKNETFPGFYDRAKEVGLLFGAYHYYEDSVPEEEQIKVIREVYADYRVPYSLDFERGNVHDLYNIMTDYRDFSGLYVPDYFWIDLGRPHIADLGVSLWGANKYGANPKGYGSVVYAQTNKSFWNPYGGLIPDIIQFGSQIEITGYDGVVDGDAAIIEAHMRKLVRDLSVETPKPVPETEVYIVRPGDSLTKISDMFHTTIDWLLEHNREITNPNRIYPNERLIVPSGR